jgi:hypothetical protein
MKKSRVILIAVLLVTIVVPAQVNRGPRQTRPQASSARQVTPRQDAALERLAQELESEWRQKQGSPAWKLAGANADLWFFYHRRSMLWLSKDVVRVWIKETFRAGSEAARAEFIASQETPADYINYSHTLWQDEYHCAKRQFRALQFVHYDSEGTALENRRYKRGPFLDIPPDSVGEEVMEAVCKPLRAKP